MNEICWPMRRWHVLRNGRRVVFFLASSMWEAAPTQPGVYDAWDLDCIWEQLWAQEQNLA